MCINPSFVWMQRGPKWEQQPVPCKSCWRCKSNRINGYVGRALAEAATSQRVATVTLTYAPRADLADKLLHPRHFQLFMKQLRRAGHKVRYLVAGEYGDLKGRTHFHAILFFKELVPRALQYPLYEAGIAPRYKADYPEGKTQDDAPFSDEIPQMRMVHIREWPHGHIQTDWNADERSIRYVCKYILADDKNRAWFSLSKKPALGAAWFAQKAEAARALGVLPSSFNYTPPGGSKERSYLVTGATRRDYLNAITQDPADRPRMSEWTGEIFDKHHRERVQAELDGQKPSELEAAWIENRQRREDQESLMRYSRRLAETDDLEKLLQDADAPILRWRDGRWTPSNLQEDEKNGES